MPTENRSSNTEMVSVPPYIGREPLVGRYYPAKCRRCGWVGSSEELTEDDAQCTRDVGDRLCLGDCDELERHDLLSIIQAMAEQHQGEPVVLPACKSKLSMSHDWDTGHLDGWNACLDEIAKLGPLYAHAEPAEFERAPECFCVEHGLHIESLKGEVERLRAALKFYADREHYHFESGNWDTVSGEPLNILWCGDEPDFIEDGTVARNALSASAEPEAKS